MYLADCPTYGPQLVIVKQTMLEGASLEDRRLAIQEAHLLAKLKHPSIIRMYEFWEEQESIYIVMERAELGTCACLVLSSLQILSKATCP